MSATGKKRTVCLLGHGGAGKTTLAWSVLSASGVMKGPSDGAEGQPPLDTEPEERKRGLTMNSRVFHYDRDGHRVNLIDTPGYTNFLYSTRCVLRVSGGTVAILSAISGVKPQTERLWAWADENEVSRVAFVNKMDRPRADFFRAVDDMERVLGARGVPLVMPMGSGEGFAGVIDLISMRVHPAGGAPGDVPGELAGEAGAMREDLVEAIVEADDGLTERYLEGGEITTSELHAALREAVLTRRFVPVLAGSALTGSGVELLMDGINRCLPSPVDKGPTRGFVRGTDPESGEEVERSPDPDGPFSAFVFKSVIDPYTGRLSVMRVYSGTLEPGSRVRNTTRGVTEKAAHIYLLQGSERIEVDSAGPGDVVALARLKDTHTGDTLSDLEDRVLFPALPPADAVLSYALHPRSRADEDKAPEALSRLAEEDPSIVVTRDDEARELIISGSGQAHLESAVERLESRFGCSVELRAPRVPYRETIRGRARVQGRYRKQSGGHGQYGDVWLEVSPLPRGSGFVFEETITGGVVPRQFIPAVEKGVREAMARGVLAGYPVTDVKVVLVDGSHHSVDSSEMAFKVAGSMGARKGFTEADPVLLEPVVDLEVAVPEENLGDVIGDINSRRGRVTGAEPSAGGQTVRAAVPMNEVMTYATDLRSMTGDRGIFTMEFSRYEEVPTYLERKIAEASRASREDG